MSYDIGIEFLLQTDIRLGQR